MSLIRVLSLAALLMVAGVAGAAPDPKSDEFWYGTAADGTPTVRLYYFFSPTCPHCQAAAPFINEFAARSPWLEVNKYAVKDNKANARFYYETARVRCVGAGLLADQLDRGEHPFLFDVIGNDVDGMDPGWINVRITRANTTHSRRGRFSGGSGFRSRVHWVV